MSQNNEPNEPAGHAADDQSPDWLINLKLDVPNEGKVLEHLQGDEATDPNLVADALLLHSLLLQNAGSLHDSTERGLQRALSALRSNDQKLETEDELFLTSQSIEPVTEPTVHREFRSRWWHQRGLRMAVAASVIFVLLTFFWQSRLPSAKALLAQAYEYSLALLDREYQVTLTRGDMSMEGTLLVRGNEALLLTVNTIAGQQTFGRNGREYWLAPTIGPVLKSDSRYWIASILHQHSGGLPYLEPATVLQRLQSDYKLARERRVDPKTNRDSYLVTALLEKPEQSADFLRPHRVQLWIDVESGRTQRIVLERHAPSPLRDSSGATLFDGTLTIEFNRETSTLAPDYYRCESRFPDRTILSRPWSANDASAVPSAQ